MSRVLFAGEQKNRTRSEVYLALNQVYEDCLNVLKTENTWYVLSRGFTIVLCRIFIMWLLKGFPKFSKILVLFVQVI